MKGANIAARSESSSSDFFSTLAFLPAFAILPNFFLTAEASITLISLFCSGENVLPFPFTGWPSPFTCSNLQDAPRLQLPFWKSKQGFFPPSTLVFLNPPCLTLSGAFLFFASLRSLYSLGAIGATSNGPALHSGSPDLCPLIPHA